MAGAGDVLLDGRAMNKSDRLVAGALLEVEMPDLAAKVVEPSTESVPGMDIVYDDEHIVIVDKPAGVAAHPSVGWDGPDVVGGLAAAGFRVSTSGPPERKGIVSRLDVGTSGLMVVAKSELAYSALKRAFTARTVQKVYHALVQGHPEPLRGTIDAPIGRHPGNEWKFAITSDGKEAVTHYELLEMLPSAALVEVQLETGRTHQIRVHFNAIRHPLVGDLTYGADPNLATRVGLNRQWLHAMRLGFDHPATGERVEVESAAYPADLASALETIREPASG